MASFPSAPRDLPNETMAGVRTWARQISTVVNNVLRGKLNAVGGTAFTLTANAGSTTLTDARLSIDSAVLFDPLTANAAAELAAGNMHVSAANRMNGSWTVAHANNAQTDRSFRYVILG